MAEELQLAEGSKTDQYRSLLPQIRALLEGETDRVANLANIVAALKQQFPELFIEYKPKK